jgi:intracellular septation protein|tara:strand:+ start:1892 stop:2443 length:552 start_codon:yes stop_codon:yes gene_type:complete
MQFLTEYIPIIIFIIAYFNGGIFFATKALMVAMPIGFLMQWIVTKKINKIYLGSTLLVIVLGAATIFFKNPTFLYWKPTVLNWLIALVFLGSQFIGEEPIIKRMLKQAAVLKKNQWNKLNLMWVLFFLFSGTINIYVAYNYPEEFWVKFKLFGLLGITLIFIIIQSIWLNIVIKQNEQNIKKG